MRRSLCRSRWPPQSADLKAEKHITKELDVNSKDIDSAVQELAYAS
jgi:hypothetical protein